MSVGVPWEGRVMSQDVTLQKAVDAFVSQPDLAPTTQRSYRQTLAVLVGELGANESLVP